jgi:hypothetical protein
MMEEVIYGIIAKANMDILSSEPPESILNIPSIPD